MPTILLKTDSDPHQLCETITVTERTLFTSKGNAKAMITPPGGTATSFENNQFIAEVAGDYIVCLQGECKQGTIDTNPIASSGGSQRGADCTDPVHVKQCPPDEPLPVKITNAAPVPQKVIYCNEDTDTHWVKVCVYTLADINDPTSVTETVISDTDTGTPCAESIDHADVDYQTTCNSDTGTTWIRSVMNTIVDGIPTENVISDWSDTGLSCMEEPDTWFVKIGWFSRCQQFSSTVAFDGGLTVSAQSATTTIQFPTTEDALTFMKLVEDALKVEEEQNRVGTSPDEMVITLANASEYRFLPSAVVSRSSATVTIDASGSSRWDAASTDAGSLSYQYFSNCECFPVEIVQRLTPEGDLFTDSMWELNGNGGLKTRVEVPVEFGLLGPYPGQCPDEDIRSVEVLCCNDDLENNNQDVTAQRLAWLDAADTEGMLDDIGGTQIAGNDGDQVGEILDKITPNISPSFTISAAGHPVLRTGANGVNKLSVLEFNGVSDRLRLDTGNASGNDFTFFYLLSTEDVITDTATVLAVAPTNAGGSFYLERGSWQISKDGSVNDLIFRINNQTATPPTKTIHNHVAADEADGTVDAGGQALFEIGIVPFDQFADGSLHLITFKYEAGIVQIWFDGSLQSELDFNNSTPNADAVGSRLIRIFSNRDATSYLAGNLAEFFFADNAMSPQDVDTVNSYLICKWGIDPSLTTPQPGVPVELSPKGSFGGSSPFRKILDDNGRTGYLNSSTGQRFEDVPISNLSLCGEDDGAQPTEPTQLDRELICYTLDGGATIQQAWARHDDALLGQVASHIDAIGGIAYFMTTVPVQPLDITQVGFEFALCGGQETPVTSVNTGTGISEASNAGTVPDGLMEWSIINVGVAAGSVDGVTFPVGASVTMRGYFDEDAGVMRRLDGVDYDATGTTFLLSVVA